jgi:predicted Zn-dependent peptidase
MTPLRALAFALVLFAGAAAAQPVLPPGISAAASVEGITEYRLANGLQVLLVPDDSKPTTTVNVTYHVGSRHENYGETGMAHLLEHLIFKGTPRHPTVWAEFSKRGLRANGTTSFDRTNYFASFSASDDTLRWYLGWQADAMVNSFIAKKDLDTEMTVVRNEMERGENSPSRVLVQQVMSTMYWWHNYGKSTIGARADVENVDIGRLQAFYRQYYQPDNATLIVAGRFDAAKTLAWIAESFGPLPRPPRTLRGTYTLDPVQDGERSVTVRRVGGAPLLYVAHHAPPGAHPDSAAVDLLAAILGDAPSGRLHKRLVDKQLAASTFGFVWALAEPGPMFLGAQLAPGQDVERAKTELLATLADLAREPVTAEELERARLQWLKSWDLGFTDPESVGVRLSEAIAKGDWRLFFLQRDQVRKVTLADVNRVAAERLVRDNRTIGVYLPTDKPERAGARGRGRAGEGLQGRRRGRAGRVLRPHAGQPGRAHPAFHARQRPAGGAAAQGHARQGRAGPTAPALRRREEPAGAGDGGVVRRRAARQGRRRHDASADRRRVRPPACRGLVQCRRPDRQRRHDDDARAPAGRGRARRPPAARAGVPGRRAGRAAAAVARRHRAPAQGTREPDRQRAAAPRQPVPARRPAPRPDVRRDGRGRERRQR